MLCFCFLRAYERAEGLKKLQMQVFDQPADTTGTRGERETKTQKKTKDTETIEKKIPSEVQAGLK